MKDGTDHFVIMAPFNSPIPSPVAIQAIMANGSGNSKPIKQTEKTAEHSAKTEPTDKSIPPMSRI